MLQGTMQTRDGLDYLSAEIVEEGDLQICARFLIDRRGWSLARFRDVNVDLNRAGVCGYYRYGDGDTFINVGIDAIDFADMESLKGLNFSPKDAAWDFYRQHHSD